MRAARIRLAPPPRSLPNPLRTQNSLRTARLARRCLGADATKQLQQGLPLIPGEIGKEELFLATDALEAVAVDFFALGGQRQCLGAPIVERGAALNETALDQLVDHRDQVRLKPIAFIGCPVLRDVALPALSCWLARDGDKLYYLGSQTDTIHAGPVLLAAAFAQGAGQG